MVRKSTVTAAQAGEILTVPPKGQRALIAASEGTTWPEAQREWEYTGENLSDDETSFPESCEFCGEIKLRRVYKVRNKLNGNERWLGGDCIKRYLVLSGTNNVEDSARAFSRQVRKFEARDQLQELGAVFLSSDPAPKDLRALHKALARYLGVRTLDRGAVEARWEEILEAILGDAPSNFSYEDQRRIRSAIMDPQSLLPHAIRYKDDNERIGSWAYQRKIKKHVLSTTLGQSKDNKGADVAVIDREHE